MAEQDVALEHLLAAVEQAPPVESSAVIGRILAEQLGASDVCFMLTDFAGDSVWRLPAEIQHNLLPDALSCEAVQATIAGNLEPSGDIAGDTFDYSLDERSLHISITDAMGHDVPAAMLATLLVGALRNARRARAGLAAQARAADRAVTDYGQDATATGQLLRIDLTTGRALFVNAGHPWPLRLRDGRVTVIEPGIDPPFGAPNPHGHRVQDFDLAPGDRVVLLTDGMSERNTTALDLPALIADGSGLHPREAVRSMTHALNRVTGGDLLDDATVICLDWHGPGPGPGLGPGLGSGSGSGQHTP